jgi:hypothetical protein
MTDSDLMAEVDAQKAMMIAVATGGPRIETVNGEYIDRRRRIGDELVRRGIGDPNPHTDLWRWYGKWSKGDLPSYASRRMYVADLYDPLLERLRRGGGTAGSGLFEEPTGWAKVDRQIDGVRAALEMARTEEDYQGVGHRCREAIISLGQAVYRAGVHRAPDGVEPSATDAKRMLEGYLVTDHGGDRNADTRRLVKAAFDIANTVQHRRTAEFRDAALCAEGTITAVNTIAILAGRRDDTPREETAVEAAHRRERAAERRQQNDAWLRSPEGQSAATEEFETVARALTSRIDAMKGARGFRHRWVDGQTIVECPQAGLAAGWHHALAAFPLGYLAISEYDGFLTVGGLFPDDQKAKCLGTWRYTFDREETGRTGWRDSESGRDFQTTDTLIEEHLKRIIEKTGDA